CPRRLCAARLRVGPLTAFGRECSMIARRLVSTGLASQHAWGRCFVAPLAFVVLATFMLSAAPSFALSTYRFDGQLAPVICSSLGTGSVAVSDFNGDAYVAAENGEVSVFDSAKAQIGTLDSSATPAGSFGSELQVAANNGTGEGYVLDTQHNVIDVFDSTGTYLCQIT